MVSKVAVEALKIADELKDKSLTSQSTYQNLDTLAVQQQLLKIYRDVLINDLEYALDQKVEQDLWTYGFKNYIVALQNVAKDKKDNWGEFQARLSWFLDCASGFYLTLLQEMCSLFGLDLPFKRHDSLFGYRRAWSGADNNNTGGATTPERSSCYYFCQHCLVHLGDIARYRNQMVQAESFYRHAVALGANSGQPYNQLALLEATRSDRLSTVFYYTRSIAVAHRFPAAVTNLANTLRKSIQSPLPQTSLDNKMSASDYEGCFLRLHALLYVAQDIPAASGALQVMSHALTPLIATQEFSTWKLVQMAVISIFTYTQVEEKKNEVRRIVSEFLIGYLNALLLPLYTMSGDNVLDYFSLPAIYVLMCWIKCEGGVVEALNRPHLWRGLCKLLNSLRSAHAVSSNATTANFTGANSALPEDNDLRGFLPLESALSSLNYGGEELSADVAKKLRAVRIIKLGEWLAMYSDIKPIYMSENGQFDATPVTNVVSSASEHQQQPSAKVQSNMLSNPQEGFKARSRQNVALQSIFRRTLCQANEPSIDNGWQVAMPPPDTRWWPQGNAGDGVPVWSIANNDLANPNQEGTYSLFSGSPETGAAATAASRSIPNAGSAPLAHQSLWSGPGPSPLERLLEQQKQLRHSSQFNT